MSNLKMAAAFLGLISLNASFLNAEEVKVVTYYPAPYSEYKELNTTQNTNLATNTAAVSGVPTYKVGIGTGAPTEKLDVAGNVKMSGALMPNGNAGTSGQVLTSQGSDVPPSWKSSNVYGGMSKGNANYGYATSQYFAQNTTTEIVFENFDYGSGITKVGNGLQVSESGVYLIAAHFFFGTTGVSKEVQIGIRRASNSPFLMWQGLTPSIAGAWITPVLTGTFYLNANDTITATLHHNVATNYPTVNPPTVGYLNMYTGRAQTHLSIIKVSD